MRKQPSPKNPNSDCTCRFPYAKCWTSAFRSSPPNFAESSVLPFWLLLPGRLLPPWHSKLLQESHHLHTAYSYSHTSTVLYVIIYDNFRQVAFFIFLTFFQKNTLLTDYPVKRASISFSSMSCFSFSLVFQFLNIHLFDHRRLSHCLIPNRNNPQCIRLVHCLHYRNHHNLWKLLLQTPLQ